MGSEAPRMASVLLCTVGRFLGCLPKVTESGSEGQGQSRGRIWKVQGWASWPLLSPPFSPQLSSLTQAHREALSSLTSKAGGLEKSLSSLETRRSGEAEELAAAQREAELLRKQLR